MFEVVLRSLATIIMTFSLFVFLYLTHYIVMILLAWCGVLEAFGFELWESIDGPVEEKRIKRRGR